MVIEINLCCYFVKLYIFSNIWKSGESSWKVYYQALRNAKLVLNMSNSWKFNTVIFLFFQKNENIRIQNICLYLE